jgi:K+-transporting ATPase A subunit
MDLFSATQYLLFLAIVTALATPLGRYLERVFSNKEH